MAGNGRKAYSPEYRRRMVELARSGRSPGALAKEFEPTAQTIRNWVRRADADEGLGGEGSAKALKQELAAFRRKMKRVEMEQDILKKAAAWFAMESGPSRELKMWSRQGFVFLIAVLFSTCVGDAIANNEPHAPLVNASEVERRLDSLVVFDTLWVLGGPSDTLLGAPGMIRAHPEGGIVFFDRIMNKVYRVSGNGDVALCRFMWVGRISGWRT